jgi:hypothetical protein
VDSVVDFAPVTNLIDLENGGLGGLVDLVDLFLYRSHRAYACARTRTRTQGR